MPAFSSTSALEIGMKLGKLSGLSAIATTLILGSILVLSACGGDKPETKLTAEQTKEVSERLAPAGSVALTSEVSSAPASGGAARSGEEIYNSKCMACHATGAAGAPKLGTAADWAPRLSKGKDALYASAVGGFKGMPPKGLCMDCSEAEIHSAVDFILAKSK